MPGLPSAAVAAIGDPATAAIVICPSNPYLSIDPILAVPGFADMLRAASAPVIAVTPIIGGKAVKGPTAKIMAELGVPVAASAVARHYDGLLDGFVLDGTDAGEQAAIAVPTSVTNTLMLSLDDRESLARHVLGFADRLRQ